MQWLSQIKGLLDSGVEANRLKKFVELLAQEIPIVLGVELDKERLKSELENIEIDRFLFESQKLSK